MELSNKEFSEIPVDKRKFQRVQILRLFAAAAVVASHASEGVRVYFGGVPWLSFLDHGARGVDLFFVISGFIIAYTARNGESNWRLFLKRRFQRILPLYWIYTLIFVSIQISLSVLAPSLVNSAAIPLSKIPQSLTFTSWMSLEAPILPVGWTLEFEMLFYILFAIAMMLRVRAALTISIIFSVAQVTWLFYPGIDKIAARFLVDPILLEFVFGMACAEFLVSRSRAMIIAAFAAVALFMPNHFRECTVGLAAVSLVAIALSLDIKRPSVRPIERALAHLGDASYSIYLAQALTNSFLLKVAAHFRSYLPMDLAIVLITVASCACGYGMYLLIERPLIRYFHRQKTLSKMPPSFAGSG